MTISLKHKFTSPKGDGTDPTLVQPSNWNDAHAIEMATAHILGRATAGTGDAEEIAIGSNLTLDATNLRVADNPAFGGSAGMAVPGGGTAARPGSPSSGVFRYNSDTALIEWWNSVAWVSPLTSVGGDFTNTRGTDVAGPTIDIDTVTGGFVVLSGGVAITGITCSGSNARRVTIFINQACTINANSCDLGVPFDISAKVGDVLVVRADSSVVFMESYQRFDGQPLYQPFGIDFCFDGGGVALTTGIKGVIETPFDGIVTQATVLLDRVGSLTVDVQSCTYGNYDRSTHPASGDTIFSGGIAVASAVKSQTSRNVGFTKGAIWAFVVPSAGGGTVQQATLSLRGWRYST